MSCNETFAGITGKEVWAFSRLELDQVAAGHHTPITDWPIVGREMEKDLV